MRASPGAQQMTTRILLVLAVSLLVVILASGDLLQLGVLRRLELSTIDFRFNARGARAGIADSSDIPK
jgi:hypothetical protein